MRMEFRFIEKLDKYRRILRLTRRPSRDEFKNTGKITGLGIFVVGIIGFMIYLLFFFTGQ
ncbi:MAG: preprotein translocase subunit SecE [Candidatus Methanolliviera sp. GoM_asphalt]|nr:MAG: preprotein translocase subunit SecE [Candidatus Methanolliviera sp. GoM_asphalt]